MSSRGATTTTSNSAARAEAIARIPGESIPSSLVINRRGCLRRRVIWSFYDYTRDPNVLLATRRAIAEEIEALQTEPLLIVQTSPPEGTAIPAGPRHVIVRGLAPPGATVSLDGQPIKNVRPSGYFFHYSFLSDGPTITVTVEHRGKKRTVTRTFKLVD